MKLKCILIVACSLFTLTGQADEGMWMLGNLNKQTRKTMKELGLQMPADRLYNPKKPSLKDAVVSFGGFCSGVVVSEDGLVFTNHHCGFSSVQQHSSVEHDYLKDGFVARSRAEELPNPELYVRFLLRTEDVTKRVLGAVKPSMNEMERSSAVDSMMMVIGGEVSWIITKRQKTNTDVNVPLLDIPKMILKKYKGKLPDGKILPVISNQKLNAYLKEIADICGIKKNLTFHLARHTFATTTTLSKGVPIETVSKMLGHTNIETTQIYARITNSKIGSDMQGLDKKFVGIEKIYKEVAM